MDEGIRWTLLWKEPTSEGCMCGLVELGISTFAPVNVHRNVSHDLLKRCANVLLLLQFRLFSSCCLLENPSFVVLPEFPLLFLKERFLVQTKAGLIKIV